VCFGLQQADNELPTFDDIDAEDCSKFFKAKLRDWSNEDLINSIRDRFVTGNWSKAALRGQELNDNGEDDEEIYGDFEDLETGEVHKSQASENAEGNGGAHKEDDLEVEERRRKKLALRAKFDAQYPLCDHWFYYLFMSLPNHIKRHSHLEFLFHSHLLISYAG